MGTTVVVGGSSGIGRLVAERAAARGDTVVITSRDTGRAKAVAAEMSRAHYSLQALLYTVALHRYLRWRLPDYDPDRHLAGVLYLFVRGMAGEPGAGVFAWSPPGDVITALSDTLDRGGA